MLNLNSQFKTKEEIRSLAPSIFTEKGASNVSEKYTHIPTYQIIDDMELLGWKPVDAKEVKARKGVGYQKHLIVFRNEDIFIHGDDGDDVYPMILMSNSHDGKNSFIFKCSIFRLVCENGLVVSTQDFEDIKMRHMGYTFEILQEKIREMIEKLPLTVESMNKMKQIQLGQEQMMEFAKKAIATRFTEDEIERVQINLEELLTPVRKEDEGDGLWEIFNRIQEKIIDGDFNYISGNKIRKARKIKNFQQNIKINSKLWELAESYI